MKPEGIILNIPKVFVGEVGEDYILRIFEDHLNHDGCYFQSKIIARPRQEVLYCYILHRGKIRWRTNIAGYEPGSTEIFNDGLGGKRKVTARCWILLTGPVVRPPREIRMTGFRGFRYTEALW